MPEPVKENYSMIDLLLATTSTDKIREMTSILTTECPLVNILTPGMLNLDLDVPEDGKTFRENAEKKAVVYGEKTGLLTMAEDSGLEVDVLGGRPGIFSARYLSGSDEDRVNKLLKEMEEVSSKTRNARYFACVVLYDPVKKKVVSATGITKGYITGKSEGKRGFGYDPIFYSIELGKTFGMATMDEKNSVSHRGRAIRKIIKIITAR